MTASNKEKVKVIITVIILIAIVIIANAIIRKPEVQTVYKEKTITKIDTIYSRDTINLFITKPVLKTVYKEKIDTIIITQAFEKTIDTTMPNLHLKATYLFPQDSFRLWLDMQAKEIIRTDTVTIEIPILQPEKKSNGWLYGSIGAVGGFVLGIILMK